MSEVAVVILNYNGKELLRQFLPSVIQFSPSAKIIVADNASTDGSVELLATQFPQLDVIRVPSNLGFCGGYNFALKKIQATYYVLLNSDVEVTAGWLGPLHAALAHDPQVAAVQPKILSYHQKNIFEYAGAAGGFVDSLGYPFCRGRIFQQLEEDKGQYNDTIPVFWATGACLMIRSELYHRLGGLDEDFFAHMEEIDLCWKLKRMGYQVLSVGASRVYHVGGGTLSAGNPRKTYFNFRNGLMLLCHHLPASTLWWKLPLRFALDWIAAAQFLLSSAANAVAVLKAHVHFVLGLGKTLRKRNYLKAQIPNLQVANVYPRLIVASFFIRGKKTFDQLERF